MEDPETKSWIACGLRNVRGLLVLPGEAPPAPFSYTSLLVSYVGAVCFAAIVVGAASWQPLSDPTTLLVGVLIVVGMAAFAVRTISGVDAVWSASVSIHLAMTLSLGPTGAILAALADGLVGRALAPGGWFRNTFNTAAFVLTNLSVWWAVKALCGSITPATAPLAGLTSGAVAWVVDYVLIAGVIEIASRGRVPFLQSLRSAQTVLPHTLAYGWAAAGVALLHHDAGTFGFTMLLVPVVSAQVFLVHLARRANAHQRELREAEEAERRRIARDIHDGVVQVVVGYSMRLAAASDNIQTELGHAAQPWHDLMSRAAEALRGSARDLRTLIIQIAPPSLQREGLRAALGRLCSPLVEGGTNVRILVPDDLALPQADAELLFRVAQEALRNTAAHANASEVSVEVRIDPLATMLAVIDDGTGFSPEDVAERRREGHVGTRGLEELATERGAALTIHSSPGRGTRVCLTIPAGP